MVNILFAGGSHRWPQYQAPLRHALDAAGLSEAVLATDLPPAEVDYIVYAPTPDGFTDFTPYTRCKAVLSLWAGVEKIVGNASLTMPLTRMVDDGLRAGMIEWVTGQVLRHHLGIDRLLANQSGDWRPEVPPLARDRPVTILGLGALGAACAGSLTALGFPVTGWSRRPKDLPGLTCLSGPDGLTEALRRAEILVLLLPATPETDSLLDAARLSLLPEGAVILNPGRGTLIDDDALLDALDSGAIGHATLDVVRQEPLPPEHRFWAHPRVTVSPHVASETRPDTASEIIAENVRRAEAGEPLLHLVDRAAGY
ncbi:hydroxyacid dehydrogenase [Oceanicola sp. 22II-s10i]|uniref:2-hydroxyacid dehydrogenase n=1 Tax=Oceanicola sp. 22II-s10i TaxID=1317116 RepID=UPI000B528D3A|nr:glyoxylate/hydroxypyruvate reductase A [Oceanicola sp. 22II-s10i]OWU85031.1 hydroxyacid dehydrogenase [Oceanicola sp. 22II-s10i]